MKFSISLQRIGHSLRQDGPRQIHLERFKEALDDSALTLLFLISASEVLRMLSGCLVAWMKNMGYQNEAEYLQYVHNWRRACDERGLSKYNRELLNYILDDLMPWHKKDDSFRDFSMLEVNQYASFITTRGGTCT